MSMFLKAVEKENAGHQGGGGNLDELIVRKRKGYFVGDLSEKMYVCVNGSGACIGLLKPLADLTKQLQ